MYDLEVIFSKMRTCTFHQKMKTLSLLVMAHCIMVHAGCSVPKTTDWQGRPLETISSQSPRLRAGYGPPPYKYWRIVGGTVPKEGFALEPTTDFAGPMSWSFIGPRPITNEYWSGGANAGGRVASIACHPTNAQIAYIATASGGVWKTDNSGVNWTPLTDAMPNMNHGAIAIDRTFPNTVYAGTGEYVSGSDGDGLYRTLDSGQTWLSVASLATLGYQCSGLEVISGSTASTPSAIHWTGSGGYRRSTNGGATWTNGGVTASCSSLAVNRSDPQQIYVAQQSVGIRKSTNGGTSFTLLTGGLPTTGIARIVLAISPSAPSTLYAAFVTTSNGELEGLYKTEDGGANWVKLTATPNFPKPQGSWDLSIGIDPTNPNHLFCGGVSPIYQIAGVIETTNGGSSWSEISASNGQIHPDQQCIAFDANNVPWFGCDGGVWRRVNNAWVNCNATLAANQNYTIAQHPNDPNRLMVGTQDNGTAATTSASLAWPQIMTGDGGFGAYNSSNFSTLFTTYVFMQVYRLVNATQTNITGPWSSDQRDWISPLVADTNAPNTIYAGTDRIWRNTAAATTATWTAISTTTISDLGVLSAITTVKGVPNAIWAGNTKGGVWRTLDAGITWTQMRVADGIKITALAAKIGDINSAFISRRITTGSRVLQTVNGTTWINVSGTLPASILAKTIAIDWNRPVPTIYLGSAAGIYVSFTLGATWIKNGTDLPNVNIGQLEIDTTQRTVIVGTYGRGAWRTPMPLPADINADGSIDGTDLSFLLASWGTCPSSSLCPSDIVINGVVDGADLTTLLSAFGN